MSILEKDIKLLWGRAAGRCSAPECQFDLTPSLTASGPMVLGEMAHVIGRKPGSARSNLAKGIDDTYQNLILLCPNCHTRIDKAPEDFPPELLQKWKADWERQVGGLSLQVTNRADLLREIASRLIANHSAFQEWGPISVRATVTPQSWQSAEIWQYRRLSVIIPNNRAIVTLLRTHTAMLSSLEWAIACNFIEHAEFYESHVVDPKDASAYLRFPEEFANMIRGSVE